MWVCCHKEPIQLLDHDILPFEDEPENCLDGLYPEKPHNCKNDTVSL